MLTTKQLDFYKMLLGERWEHMPAAEARAADRSKDDEGEETSSLGNDHRFIGITTYLVSGDVNAFRRHLAKSVELQLALFRRFDAGEPIDKSFVSMLAYKDLFDALASANIPLAMEFAQTLGGRHELERDQDAPFTIAMGYALKEAVLETGSSARQDLNLMLNGPEPTDLPREDAGFAYRDFRGYGLAFDALAARDEQAFNRALSMILEGHQRQSKKGMFRGFNDEYLCVWGLGVANLAKDRGLTVRAESGNWIPDALVI